MNLVLVPVPSESLNDTLGVWYPFLQRIAERTHQHADHLLEQVITDEIQVHIAWEPEAKEAHALAGTRIIRRGDDRIGEVVWTTGIGRRRWLPLLDDLERYHREHLGCNGMSAVARPGWQRELKARGYKLTHVVLEKDFGHGR